MRRRFQKPRIRNKGGYWIAQYRDLEGRKRKVSLGPVTRTKKVDAEHKLARLLEPVNSGLAGPTAQFRFGAFVRQVYLPFYRRKWKTSTRTSNEGRIALHLSDEFDPRSVGDFSRNELQTFLDRKASEGHSYSVVAHLRWDLRQIFRMAVAEGCLSRNPAELLFIPRDARRYPKPRLTLEQRVIAGFAILAGMRPGEIYALRRCHIENGRADIRQRVYQGQIDTPKTFHSRRWAGLGDGLSTWLELWLAALPAKEAE
jgi:integrase